MKYATKEGTFAYLKQFSDYSRSFYRYTGDFFVSSLGLGTFRKEPYREENYVISYKEAVKTSIENGVNVIDTAINYRYQVSEREIGEALEELFRYGVAKREALVVASKAGFIPLSFPFPENPYTWIEENVVEKGLATKEEVVIDQHCMSPGFLRWSVEKSLENLKLETLDILYLHNPETQLGYVDRSVVMARIKEAFRLFEALVEEGKIRSYGIASWNGFLYEEEHAEYLSLSEMIQIAVEAGGTSHHFRYIQSPFNLAKPHAYSYSNQK
ncbi:MAG TPA: aldo/keto reductase, partial [Epsilonproteobacteria bacterium]|nr:aldo/keto reductase [Campylobacterota bacterium]